MTATCPSCAPLGEISGQKVVDEQSKKLVACQ